MDALISSGLVDEMELLSSMARVFAMPLVDRLDHPSSVLLNILNGKRFTQSVSSHFLKKVCMVPVSLGPVSLGNYQVGIAMHNPLEFPCADDLCRILGISLAASEADQGGSHIFRLAPKSAILSAINHIYSEISDTTQRLVENMEETGSSIIKEIEETSDILDDTSDAPVIRLVNHMISQSAKARASDIHIEPFQDTIKIRYRIDGILYDLLEPPKWIQSALVSRIKVMADMNIAERRVPQDGRFEVRAGDNRIDIRVSTVPTSFGERLVMRLLNKSGTLLELSASGISPGDFAVFSRLIKLNNGIVLVTGPTGSGKTTTLYAALSSINSPDKNIITIEDPVEYNLKGIGQIQVNRKTGMTFAKGLRSIVRQDPDVILVGEIRDLETAEIAIQSALTGHLVFSTLHTNDAPGALTRLVDLGVEPYLITSSLKAVAAQRLVRVLCSHCKEKYQPDAGEKTILGIHEKIWIFRPRGCPRCFDTGYAGRTAIFEIMEITEPIKGAILATSDADRIRREALEQGMTTLRMDGISK
ncbi:MAG: Flp pilus assembly complex ATPase component TadA, partial [Desulfamplus sp.]|nr:Flp pilus assembly complex ATPase component TadA [Desulfamplus sp.]